MLVKPNTALTGVPSGLVIGGRAWKARKMKPDPSIRIRCSLRAADSAGASAGVFPAMSEGMSMSVGVIGSWVHDVKTRTIRTHNLFRRNAEKDPGVTQGTVSTIAGHGARVHVDYFGRSHRGSGRRQEGSVRHFDPLSGRGGSTMIAIRQMLSTMLL